MSIHAESPNFSKIAKVEGFDKVISVPLCRAEFEKEKKVPFAAKLYDLKQVNCILADD